MLLPQALEEARALLAGERNSCDTACHGCLLGYDTQADMERLNRHQALELLGEVWTQRAGDAS